MSYHYSFKGWAARYTTPFNIRGWSSDGSELENWQIGLKGDSRGGIRLVTSQEILNGASNLHWLKVGDNSNFFFLSPYSNFFSCMSTLHFPSPKSCQFDACILMCYPARP